ncbi:MAG: hypothetical protein FWG38_10220 [Defluviitaleaceae bacterium]|nr:hypothetical protein [Defluviitaleaceae bacterium]
MPNNTRKAFERMGNLMQQHLSTAYLDIRRQVGHNPGAEVHSNIHVNATRVNVDNPDPNAVSATPVIVTMRLAMPVDTDVQNGDILIVKRADSSGHITEAWRGTAAEPYTAHSRRRVLLTMQQLSAEDIRGQVAPLPV